MVVSTNQMFKCARNFFIRDFVVRYVIVVKVNMSSKKLFCKERDDKRLNNYDFLSDDSDLEQKICDFADDNNMWSGDEEFEQLMCKAVDDYESNQRGVQQNVQGRMIFYQASLKIVFDQIFPFRTS